jgi:hypothetical protein
MSGNVRNCQWRCQQLSVGISAFWHISTPLSLAFVAQAWKLILRLVVWVLYPVLHACRLGLWPGTGQVPDSCQHINGTTLLGPLQHSEPLGSIGAFATMNSENSLPVDLSECIVLYKDGMLPSLNRTT